IVGVPPADAAGSEYAVWKAAGVRALDGGELDARGTPFELVTTCAPHHANLACGSAQTCRNQCPPPWSRVAGGTASVVAARPDPLRTSTSASSTMSTKSTCRAANPRVEVRINVWGIGRRRRFLNGLSGEPRARH